MNRKFIKFISMSLVSVMLFSLGGIALANDESLEVSNYNTSSNLELIPIDDLFRCYIDSIDILEDDTLKLNTNSYSYIKMNETNRNNLSYTIDEYNKNLGNSFVNAKSIDFGVLFSQYTYFFDELEDGTLKVNISAYTDMSETDRNNLRYTIDNYNLKLASYNILSGYIDNVNGEKELVIDNIYLDEFVNGDIDIDTNTKELSDQVDKLSSYFVQDENGFVSLEVSKNDLINDVGFTSDQAEEMINYSENFNEFIDVDDVSKNSKGRFTLKIILGSRTKAYAPWVAGPFAAAYLAWQFKRIAAFGPQYAAAVGVVSLAFGGAIAYAVRNSIKSFSLIAWFPFNQSFTLYTP